MKNIKIFISHHKKDFLYQDDVLQPIQVGSDLNKIDLGYLKDNDGINISKKNIYYSEMTAMYWVVNNYKLPDYVGFFHYRRFFTPRSNGLITTVKKYIEYLFYKVFGGVTGKGIVHYYDPSLNFFDENEVVANVLDLEKWLNNTTFDIVISNTIQFSHHNVYSWFGQIGNFYIDELRNIVAQNYPDYLEYLNKVMYSREVSVCNMFIMKKEYFKEYCDFVFNVLFLHEKVFVKSEDFCKPYFRISGYLAEVLTNVYVLKVKCAEDIVVKKLNIMNIKIKQ